MFLIGESHIDEQFSRATLVYWRLSVISMDWLEEKNTGKPLILNGKIDGWFPVDFPLNQSIDYRIEYRNSYNTGSAVPFRSGRTDLGLGPFRSVPFCRVPRGVGVGL